jgi:hypothetical protein
MICEKCIHQQLCPLKKDMTAFVKEHWVLLRGAEFNISLPKFIQFLSGQCVSYYPEPADYKGAEVEDDAD